MNGRINRESPYTEFDLFKERCEIPVRINYLSGEIELYEPLGQVLQSLV